MLLASAGISTAGRPKIIYGTRREFRPPSGQNLPMERPVVEKRQVLFRPYLRTPADLAEILGWCGPVLISDDRGRRQKCPVSLGFLRRRLNLVAVLPAVALKRPRFFRGFPRVEARRSIGRFSLYWRRNPRRGLWRQVEAPGLQVEAPPTISARPGRLDHGGLPVYPAGSSSADQGILAPPI